MKLSKFFSQLIFNRPQWSLGLAPMIRLFDKRWLPDTAQAKVIGVDVDDEQQMATLRLLPGRGWRGFHAGQHIPVLMSFKGRIEQRFFSVCCSPDSFAETGVVTLMFRIKGGFTQRLAKLAIGEQLRIGAAQGKLLWASVQPKLQPVTSLLVAGGSGITPLFSLLQQHLAYAGQRVVLVYYAKKPWLWSVFQLWAKRYPWFEVHWVNSGEVTEPARDANISVINGQGSAKPNLIPLLRDFGINSANQLGQALLCGPNNAMQHWRQQLAAFGVAEDKVKTESFGASDDEQPAGHVELRMGTQALPVASQMPLLMAMEQAGLSPEYGCRQGVCQQCVCVKKSGKVRNLLTGEISEQPDQSIALCISQALSNVELEEQV